ncbi:MAG: exonuclease domain-containing protein [Ardenticatenaceae bacterium]
MAKALDQILVIDIEATCWEGKPPAGEESEIIEVGICTVDLGSRRRLEKRSILVRPERSRVSPFCTKLTTLTQEEVEKGISFTEACSILKKEYAAKKRVWASYGDYDRRQFERQCRARNIGYPFGPTHLNVKNLFALMHQQQREVGLSKALDLLGLPLEGIHHRGHDDAWNIANLLCTLLSKNT